MDPEVVMENQVMMVHKEKRDLQDILESVSTYQVLPVEQEEKEIKDNQEILVLLVKMVILELLDLIIMENVANMHHLVSQDFLVDQGDLVKMADQDSQECQVEKDKEAEALDWTNLRIKLLMASNHFAHNYKIVVIEINIDTIIISISDICLMILSCVHHVERHYSFYAGSY